MGETSFEYSRIPLIFAFQETVSAKDTYAGQIGTVALTAQLLKPKDVESNTVVVFMHPIGGGSYLPILHSLAKQGVHVLWCDSRYRGTDSALIMEKVLIDLSVGRQPLEKLINDVGYLIRTTAVYGNGKFGIGDF